MITLLVVDDEPSVRKLIQRFFQSRGYAVITAENGLAGWTAARDHLPDLLLSDVSMPEMDGYELTRTIRRNPATAGIPVILLSAHRESDAMVAGYECGADDYVAKPVDLEVLKLKIEALLRRTVARPEAGSLALGKLICVTAAKGGVGVTMLAANLAVLLCRRSETVCVVDLGLEHGDLPVLFDMQPQLTIVDAIRDLGRQGDGLQWDDYLPRHPAGPRLLAAPIRPHDADAIEAGQVNDVVARIRGLHDFVVADLPPGYGETALNVLEAADRIVAITSPEITSLRRTRELLGVLSSLAIPDERILVVLNHIVDVSGIDVKRVEAFLRRPVAVSIPNDGSGAFTEAVTTGRPVALSQAESAPVRALSELAGML